MSIRIVTDSTCDLPPDLVRAHRITVIPTYIHTPVGNFRDGVELSRQDFYARLPGFHPAATTAAPGPEVFQAVYEQLAAEGVSEVLSIHVSSQLSAICEIASRAAAATGLIPVTVFDSRQLSLGTGFQVLAAAQFASEGLSMKEILSRLEDQIRRTHVFAALDTLEFLRRSGRMNLALSFIGTLLKIKPFLKMYAGEATAERIRTRAGAMRRLVELVHEAAPLEKIALLHSNALERAKAVLEEVKDMLPGGDILVAEITPVIGTHLGPGVIGFACITRK